MISSTGIYLTIHYCSSEDIAGLFLFTPLTGEPCEHHIQGHNEMICCNNPAGNHPGSETDNCCDHTMDGTNMCSLPDEMPECCSNTVLYISVEDDFVKTDHPALHLNYNIPLSAFGLDIIDKAGNTGNLYLAEYVDPPPIMYGRELTFFNRILLL